MSTHKNSFPNERYKESTFQNHSNQPLIFDNANFTTIQSSSSSHRKMPLIFICGKNFDFDFTTNCYSFREESCSFNNCYLDTSLRKYKTPFALRNNDKSDSLSNSVNVGHNRVTNYSANRSVNLNRRDQAQVLSLKDISGHHNRFDPSQEKELMPNSIYNGRGNNRRAEQYQRNDIIRKDEKGRENLYIQRSNLNQNRRKSDQQNQQQFKQNIIHQQNYKNENQNYQNRRQQNQNVMTKNNNINANKYNLNRKQPNQNISTRNNTNNNIVNQNQRQINQNISNRSNINSNKYQSQRQSNQNISNRNNIIANKNQSQRQSNPNMYARTNINIDLKNQNQMQTNPNVYERTNINIINIIKIEDNKIKLLI
jgi:hypothetical protein